MAVEPPPTKTPAPGSAFPGHGLQYVPTLVTQVPARGSLSQEQGDFASSAYNLHDICVYFADLYSYVHMISIHGADKAMHRRPYHKPTFNLSGAAGRNHVSRSLPHFSLRPLYLQKKMSLMRV